jgi:Skp family chaperone for outer membrane proteins
LLKLKQFLDIDNKTTYWLKQSLFHNVLCYSCLFAGHKENYPKRLDDEKVEEMQRKLNELKQELRHEAEEEQRKLDELKQQREAEEEQWKLDELKHRREAEEQQKKLNALKQHVKELRREVEERQRKLNDVLKLQIKIENEDVGSSEQQDLIYKTFKILFIKPSVFALLLLLLF